MLKTKLNKALTLSVSLLTPALSAISAPLPSEATRLALEKFAHSNLAQKEKNESLSEALKPEVEAGDPVAKFFLGGMILSGAYGLDKNQSYELFQQSAEGGCAGAAGILGAMLIKKDPAESFKWLAEAAESGDTGSRLFLSAVYLNGNSYTQKNEAKALAWAELAFIQANSDFMKRTAQQQMSRISYSAPENIKQKAKVFLAELENKHPKQDPYLCGQSTPQS